VWARDNGQQVGSWLTIDETWALAIAWYHDRLDANFHSRSFEDAVAIFQRLGLIGPFWSLDSLTPTP
jgi:hypothetical protein